MTGKILYGERDLRLEPSEVWFSWLIASVFLGALGLLSLIV